MKRNARPTSLPGHHHSPKQAKEGLSRAAEQRDWGLEGPLSMAVRCLLLAKCWACLTCCCRATMPHCPRTLPEGILGADRQTRPMIHRQRPVPSRSRMGREGCGGSYSG